MPETTLFAPGKFSWLELMTSDEEGALRFYMELFGWTDDPSDMGDGSMYHMLGKDGRYVGALYKRGDVPPSWNVYVTVANADQSARRAQELGGTVMLEPFDVFDSGRMAVLGDPQGAVFSLWQPKDHPGFGVYGETGTPCWFELNARDLGAAKSFYTALFGWSLKESPEYTELSLSGEAIGGMLPTQWPAEVPSFWMAYIAVENCDETAEKAKNLGGSVTVPPMDIPKVGRFSVVNDPQGAVIAVISLQL
ncbi:MAG TPA: VOC family protein [Thermoanaerobaculia bacterium]|jgi:hypothetical protein